MKRVLAVVLILIAIMSSVAMPAYAAGYAWRQLFSGFQELKVAYGNTYKDYTIALQLCLSLFDDKYWNELEKAGGIDGYYGSGTKYAVELYQADSGLSADGICGKQTWSQVAADLTVEEYDFGYAFFYIDGINVIRATNVAPYKFQYYCVEYGETALGPVFHTATSVY